MKTFKEILRIPETQTTAEENVFGIRMRREGGHLIFEKEVLTTKDEHHRLYARALEGSRSEPAPLKYPPSEDSIEQINEAVRLLAEVSNRGDYPFFSIIMVSPEMPCASVAAVQSCSTEAESTLWLSRILKTQPKAAELVNLPNFLESIVTQSLVSQVNRYRMGVLGLSKEEIKDREDVSDLHPHFNKLDIKPTLEEVEEE